MSKRLSVEPAFLENIASGVEREMGSGYEVIREPRRECPVDLRSPADLAVIEHETGHVTLVEIKIGILDDDDVPIATTAELREMQEASAHLHARVVLVTTMRVGETVEHWLSHYGIEVVRGRTSAEIVPRLVEMITAESVAHR